MAIYEKGSLVLVAVPAEDEIDAVGLEERVHALPHFDSKVFDVRAMAAPRVGRMMPIGDDPILVRGRQVFF